jgi:ABC-type Zn2+ transport system substrate-binding protein/surface adhesin
MNPMKTFRPDNKFIATIFTCVILSLVLSACSDDSQKNVSTKTETREVPNPFDHSHDEKITDEEKHKFEHQFADQCIQRELNNTPNSDKSLFSKPCMCIAQYLMKDLTAQEAEKFMMEHENTQSLKIKYNAATYHCLQQNAPHKDPGFVNY